MKTQEHNILSLSVRLQRLNDTLRKDAGLIYKKYNANFMNKWYAVLIILNEKSPISLTELASELGYAHPSVIQLVNEMQEENLIKSSSHQKDKRRRIISINTKGKKLLENILPFAKAMAQSLIIITKTDNNIMLAIEEVEARLKKESFYKRVVKILEKKPPLAL